jgi:glycosyltransferase involved in cell wall biosynthesis
VVLSPGFKAKLVERGVPPEKVEVIYNWCEEGKIEKGARNEALAGELGFAGRFNIVFAGTMGKAQALDAVLEAAGTVQGKIPAVRFVFIGGGIEVERLRRVVRERRLGNVLFLPRRPFSEIGAILNLADVLLVHLKDEPLFRITIPSKIQAYLAIGRPLLAGVCGDAADLVRKAEAGLVCTPENAGSIAASVETLFHLPKSHLDTMGENGLRYYRRELSSTAGIDKFEKIFRAAVAGN